MTDSALILILGGARSGKSRYAEVLATEYGPQVLYIATAQAGDAEMAERIAKHQADRPASWRTLEAPLAVGTALAQINTPVDVVLLDCVTLWTTNILLDLDDAPPDKIEAAMLAEVDALLAAQRQLPGEPPLIAVSNEVGLGLVPPYPMGRIYRDLLGRINQYLARRAHQVIFMLAGLPMEMKPLVSPAEEK